MSESFHATERFINILLLTIGKYIIFAIILVKLEKLKTKKFFKDKT